MTPFPWKDAIGFGLGVLRLSPAAFWSMTPRELALAITAVTGGVAPLRRSEFERLMEKHPDDRRGSNRVPLHTIGGEAQANRAWYKGGGSRST